jgi:DNA-binding ferritin-like protein (Dps family)
MATGWTKLLEKVVGPLEQKKRWRQYKARVDALPDSYRTATKAIQRYSYYFGGGTGEGSMQMLEDLADLFEQAAASETPIREIVGENPDDFAKEFFANYPKGQWIIRERDRLTKDIERAAGEDTGSGTGSEGAAR